MEIAEAWRRTQRQKCACTQCFYCGAVVVRHEHDHYPIPKRAGGAKIVGACLDCHDLKDRFLLRDWDISAYAEAMLELLRKLSAQTLEALQSDGNRQPEVMLELCSPEWDACWMSLSPLARVLYAKLRCMREDDLYTARRLIDSGKLGSR